MILSYNEAFEKWDVDMLAPGGSNPSYQEIFEAGQAAERARIRRELKAWLIGDVDPRDAGLYNSRRIVNEINRICPEEG